jgi:hypothetical protein
MPPIIRILLAPLAIICLASCKPAKPWYSDLIMVGDGSVFHSEVSLGPGEASSVVIPSTVPMGVGFELEKGYEITKSDGYFYMGTAGDPHMVTASPGASTNFTPVDGVIRVRFENGSKIPTKVAIYTKPADKK